MWVRDFLYMRASVESEVGENNVCGSKKGEEGGEEGGVGLEASRPFPPAAVAVSLLLGVTTALS